MTKVKKPKSNDSTEILWLIYEQLSQMNSDFHGLGGKDRDESFDERINFLSSLVDKKTQSTTAITS